MPASRRAHRLGHQPADQLPESGLRLVCGRPGPVFDGATEYYAYHTGSNFPVRHSTDLVNWTLIGTAFSTRPDWVLPTGDWHPWAPSVLRANRSCPGMSSPACYFMYYVGLHRSAVPATHCVGVATSPTPAGPFEDRGPLPPGDGCEHLRFVVRNR